MKTRHLFASVAMASAMAFASSAYALTSQEFVQKASVANEFEIETSQVALEKTQNSDVKRFAQEMVDDHSKTGEKLKETLKKSKSNAEIANALDAEHQKKLDLLKTMSGKDFDSKYIAIQTDAHKEAISLFSDYAAHGDDPALKQFASETLPALKGHQNHVKKLTAN